MALPAFQRQTGTEFGNSLSEIAQQAEEGDNSLWYTSKNHLTQLPSLRLKAKPP